MRLLFALILWVVTLAPVPVAQNVALGEQAPPTPAPTSATGSPGPAAATVSPARAAAAAGSAVDPAVQIGPPPMKVEATPTLPPIPIAQASLLGRDRLVFSSDRTGNQEVYLVGADGWQARQLTADARFDSFWARVSPDRQRILFYRRPKGSHGDDFTHASLWMINPDGSGLREVRPQGADGWGLQGHAEWSPDGRHLVMSGGPGLNPQLYITDAEGKNPRQVTDRPAMSIDPSWSPDGSRLVFISCATPQCPARSFEVFTIGIDGGQTAQLTNNNLRDHDPYFSPDGRSIAWLSETDPDIYVPGIGAWNILMMASDGSQQRNLTNDRHINAVPQWSKDGSRIYFHRLELGGRIYRWSVFSIQRDGTGMAEITVNAPGNTEFPSP